MKPIRKNAILDLSFEFALQIIEYIETLEEKRKFIIARQVLKSGTSIGANIREAQSAESKSGFIHELKIRRKKLKKLNTGYSLPKIKELS